MAKRGRSNSGTRILSFCRVSDFVITELPEPSLPAAGIVSTTPKFKALFTGKVDFSAVFTTCAPQALRAILESGYRVPEDISLLTLGEDPMFEFMYPSITSVSGNPEAIVRKAVEQAFSELNDSASKHWIIVKHTVIPRESTAKYKTGEVL